MHLNNTFNLPHTASALTVITDAAQLQGTNEHAGSMILGAGSNILFTKNIETPVLQNAIKGINLIDETPTSVTLQIGSGENWHEFVVHCANNQWSGIENLALIPGTVGAAIIQNIGAYGVEIKNTILKVAYVDLTTGTSHSLDQSECQFGYRDSIFKQKYLDHYFITSVTFLLKKAHQFKLNYFDLAKRFAENPPTEPMQVVQAVCDLRRQKLPDPNTIGNAGSFFKNPEITPAHYQQLQSQHAFKKFGVSSAEKVKISAGQLIEYAGWKGYTDDSGAGVSGQHALVLVNAHAQSGLAIADLAKRIQTDIQMKFNVLLEAEVRIVF